MLRKADREVAEVVCHDLFFSPPLLSSLHRRF